MTAQPTRDQLRALANAATPGPWNPHPAGKYVWTEDLGGIIQNWSDDANAVADMEFIAAAREAVPALLDRIARLEAQSDIRGRAVVMYRERAREAEARIEAVQDVHYPAHNDQGRTPFCETCKGAPGVHECGCGQDEQQVPVCGHCRGWKGVGAVDWPCPTIRALEG